VDARDGVSVLALDGAPADIAEVGGKARGLAELKALGLPVPPAVVLTTAAHARWRERGAVAESDAWALEAAVRGLGEPLAVRSSAVDEDAGDRSAAGQYESVMGVRGTDALRAAVERCYRAAEGDRASAYRGGAPARVALVVQREVRADRAGIAFSIDPVSGDPAAVVIECVFGHGEGAVAGMIAPDRYRVARDGGTVRARIADKRAAADGTGAFSPLPVERRAARTLRDEEAQAVAGLALSAEAGAGRPVDVEFCLERGALWAVQCRPITTLPADG
jgi:phosphoenolpyruvate synthase/pyruvate phosphate dikinase